MNRLLALGVIMAVAASACLGSGSALQVQPVTHPRPQALAAHAWLVSFASREARALGDPSLKTALVAPITAAQARIVFQHRRRAYPGDTYLVVLHGSFVTPNRPCEADAWGCPVVTRRRFGWQVMLASPSLGRAWRYFGIETDGLRLRALPVALKRIALQPDPADSPTGRRPWFSWATLEYRPGLAGRPAAFRVLPPPRNPNEPVPGVRVNWAGLPQLGNPGSHFSSGRG